MDFSKELQQSLGEHNPSEIEELILDDLYQNISALSQNHQKALEKYTSLIHLSLQNFGLESLNNFPSISTLQILELNSNNLKGDDFEKITGLFPQLYKIKIASNKIESIECFKAFAKSKISKIEVENNPFAFKNKNYSETLFKLLPNVKTIDRHDSEGEEVDTTHYDEEEEEDVSFEDEENEEDEEIEGKDESEVEEENDDEEDEDEDNDDEDGDDAENNGQFPIKKKREN